LTNVVRVEAQVAFSREIPKWSVVDKEYLVMLRIGKRETLIIAAKRIAICLM